MKLTDEDLLHIDEDLREHFKDFCDHHVLQGDWEHSKRKYIVRDNMLYCIVYNYCIIVYNYRIKVKYQKYDGWDWQFFYELRKFQIDYIRKKGEEDSCTDARFIYNNDEDNDFYLSYTDDDIEMKDFIWYLIKRIEDLKEWDRNRNRVPLVNPDPWTRYFYGDHT